MAMLNLLPDASRKIHKIHTAPFAHASRPPSAKLRLTKTSTFGHDRRSAIKRNDRPDAQAGSRTPLPSLLYNGGRYCSGRATPPPPARFKRMLSINRRDARLVETAVCVGCWVASPVSGQEQEIASLG